MKNKTRNIVLTVVALALLAGGYFFWDDGLALIDDPRILNAESDICSSDVVYTGAAQADTTRTWLIKSDNQENNKYAATTISTFGLQDDTYHLQIADSYQKLEPLSSLQNEYTLNLNAKDLEEGTYDSALYKYIESDGCHVVIENFTFNVSQPLYVATSLDWEGYDVTDEQLKSIADFADKFNTPLTHFFNPRIYIPAVFSSVRAEVLTDWVINRENDEIGLHLHMYKDMVEEIGITPIMEPTWDGRATGSDVPMTVYSIAETEKMLRWSKEQFAANGLPEPMGFRAGGWFADADTLQALENEGFLYDSSGRTLAQIGSEDLELPWSLQSTTQPYQPSKTDINDTTPEPQFDIWELPNNGLEGFRNSPDELINNFEDNFSGQALDSLTVITYLIHPQVAEKELPKMIKAYETIASRTADADNGPVIFTTMEDVYLQVSN